MPIAMATNYAASTSRRRSTGVTVRRAGAMRTARPCSASFTIWAWAASRISGWPSNGSARQPDKATRTDNTCCTASMQSAMTRSGAKRRAIGCSRPGRAATNWCCRRLVPAPLVLMVRRGNLYRGRVQALNSCRSGSDGLHSHTERGNEGAGHGRRETCRCRMDEAAAVSQ